MSPPKAHVLKALPAPRMVVLGPLGGRGWWEEVRSLETCPQTVVLMRPLEFSPL
jgi:hypothetical protein